MVLDQILPSIEPQSFLEWTHESSEQSLAEFLPVFFKNIKVL
jgi:hypothetical protein